MGSEAAAPAVDRKTGQTAAGRLPDFIIVGAMKAGSTTVWRYLCRHPRIFLPSHKKEPQFFSRDHVYGRGIDWYRDLFREAGPGQICGEASTCYSRYPAYPRTAERMARAIPDVKLIYVLRHPVERLFSHYVHEMTERYFRHGQAPETFARFSTRNEEARCASMYSLQVAQFEKHFDKPEMLIVLIEDIMTQPGRVLTRIQKFLDLEHVDLVTNDIEYANSVGDRLSNSTKAILNRRARRFGQVPILKSILHGLPPGMRRSMRRHLVEAGARSWPARRKRRMFNERISPLSACARARLCREFALESRVIGNHIGRDLTEWRR